MDKVSVAFAVHRDTGIEVLSTILEFESIPNEIPTEFVKRANKKIHNKYREYKGMHINIINFVRLSQ